MKLRLALYVISILFVGNAFHVDKPSGKSYCRNTMKLDSEGAKSRYVSPNQISNLFSSGFIDKNDDSNEFIEDDSEEDEEIEIETSRQETTVSDESFDDSDELIEETENNEDDMGYADLDKSLDKVKNKKVRNLLSMWSETINPEDTDDLNETEASTRFIKIEPNKRKKKEDPMNYGAYRRWKAPTSDEKSSVKNKQSSKRTTNSKTKSKEKGSTTDNFYNAIKKLGSGPVPKGTASSTGVMDPPPNKRNIQPKKAPTKKNKSKMITPNDIDSLFQTTSKDTQSTSNSNSFESALVQPFDEDEDEFDEEEFDDNENTSIKKTTATKQKNNNNIGTKFTDSINKAISNTKNFMDNSKNSFSEQQEKETFNEQSITTNNNDFNPLINAKEPIPQWLLDAEKETKRKKSLKLKKKKKITDDWRFWGALIAGAGFATAFFQVYQQTGGFGTNTQEELII
jgi:hypothetical protein